MKIETEIPDISRDEIIAAMASQLLGEWDREDPEAHWRGNTLGGAMRKYLDDKIAELAADMVRDQINDTVSARIEAAVDVVLAEGWQVTNEYGEPRGPKVDLKARISSLLTTSSRDYNGTGTLIERTAKAAIDAALAKDFREVIDGAKKKLSDEIDAVVGAKLRETLARALGLPK
jgi:hypothetical protein